MNNNHDFTLVNFQDHSAFVEYWHSCPECGSWKCPCGWVDWEEPDVRENIWLKLYLTDLAVDDQVTGKAYCCWGQEEWAKDLQHGWEPWPTMRGPSPPTWKHYPEPPEVNFTLDGTSWFTVLRDDDSTEVTKRTGMNGLPRIKVPEGSPEYTEVIKAFERLNELVSAVAAKEPPKQS
jgi:hypothetical protein